MSQPLLNTVLGAASFGSWGDIPTIQDPADVQKFLDVFKQNGFNQLDTARIYGTSEAILGSLDVEKQEIIVDTKVESFSPGAHSPDNLRASVKKSLEDLKVKKVHILYLHSPDRTTPIEDVLRTINEIYKEGFFEKFGLSNYSTEEVEQILKISRENNYVLPTVYQGNYNLITRKNEETLFPLLKREKISFYAYSPVAAGFFSLRKDEKPEDGRFAGSNLLANIYRGLYFKESFFAALEKLNAVSAKYGLSNVEVAVRWIYYHSQLKREDGDSVILGASARSGVPQLESNIKYARNGPLPEEVINVVEQIWNDVKDDAPNYHH